MNSTVLLSTAYLPNLQYLNAVINANNILLEHHENFIKQTYRNRCDIVTANGKLSLTIPLVKQSDKELISDKKISYSENWQQQHWRTITSAYNGSPYFEFFEDDLKPFYENKFEYLSEYNYKLLQCILHILRVKKEIAFTKGFEIHPTNSIDLRAISLIKHQPDFTTSTYYQLFSEKYGFIQNVSCLDALFNIGLRTLELFNTNV